jgi:phosphoribosylaminoimidazole-succinocarboxamide synthase
VLTALSAFWFRKLANIMPNHMISIRPTDFPFDWRAWPADKREQLRGRSMMVKKAKRIDIECVARGYLAGSGWAEYKQSGTVAGIPLPHDMVESGQLPEPLFTPANKAETGHDENITFEQLVSMVGQELAETLRDATLRIYSAAAEFARIHGIIIADTKLEFGWLGDELIVIDEMITPDSSRFWEIEKYKFGQSQVSLDKQFVRDWLLKSGWNREPPAPPIPDDVAQKTADKYMEAYQKITRHDLRSELK